MVSAMPTAEISNELPAPLKRKYDPMLSKAHCLLIAPKKKFIAYWVLQQDDDVSKVTGFFLQQMAHF